MVSDTGIGLIGGYVDIKSIEQAMTNLWNRRHEL